MTAHTLHRLAHDPAWTYLATAVIFTIGLAATILATTWKTR